ncbi:MAG TPA: thymidine phosphorylase [Candidatus Cloacimonadota bacterium]|nr:thymidine phosphorylase [Candidatus Cloacimonadota bacterium]
MKYNPVEIIIKKRSGKKLTRDELAFFIRSYLKNEIPEYQMAALLMAIYFKNMHPDEIQTLTEVYINSGKTITFPEDMPTVDKHSTGGVGDKISIVLAPIVAACGAKIPMISGRGLGHTGGTLDKLESIPGFRTDYSYTAFKKMVDEVGFSIIGQSKELVPADKRIYALRDVTGTVESLPLITASIMSKKIAEGARNLVIDLKVGSGAFIKKMERAEKLAELLMQTGKNLGQNVAVVFSNMNSTLGNYVGNALEIMECVDFLKGREIKDIYTITKMLAAEMLLLTKIASSKTEADEMFNQVLKSGKALEYFRKFVATQGGNPAICDDTSLLPQSKYQIPITAKKKGWIKAVDSQKIGYALVDVGAGRRMIESQLNYAAGAYLPFKVGDFIEKGQEIGKVFCDDELLGKPVAEKIAESYSVTPSKAGFDEKYFQEMELIYGLENNLESD